MHRKVCWSHKECWWPLLNFWPHIWNPGEGWPLLGPLLQRLEMFPVWSGNISYLVDRSNCQFPSLFNDFRGSYCNAFLFQCVSKAHLMILCESLPVGPGPQIECCVSLRPSFIWIAPRSLAHSKESLTLRSPNYITSCRPGFTLYYQLLLVCIYASKTLNA